MTKPLGKIGTIGHIDHGKTTLSAAIEVVVERAKHDVVVIGAQTSPEEFRGISPTAPTSFVIKNYHVPMEIQTIQPSGRQKRNQRRKKPKKNGRNRK
jgi:translation elongation factor EF-Tu-like GTPase